jgi:hypothetical protein
MENGKVKGVELNLDIEDIDFEETKSFAVQTSVRQEIESSVGPLDAMIMSGSTTKAAISSVAKERASDIISQGNVLKSYAKIKILEAYIGELMSEIKESAQDEASLYEKDERSVLGIKFSLKSGAKKLDYSPDAEWVKLKAAADKAEKALKEREEKLKPLIGMAQAVTDDGEVLTPPIVLSDGGTVMAFEIPK